MENNNQVTNHENQNTNNNNSTKIIAILLCAVIVVVIAATIIVVNKMNGQKETQETTTKKQYSVDGKYYNDNDYYEFNSATKTYKTNDSTKDKKKGTFTINKDTGEIVLDGKTTMFTDGRFVYCEAMAGHAKADYVDQELAWVASDIGDDYDEAISAESTYKFKSDGTVKDVITGSLFGRSGSVSRKGTYTIDKSTGLFTMDYEKQKFDLYSIVKDGTMYFHVYDKNKQLK